MRRPSLTFRRRHGLALVTALVASLGAGAGAAQAVVIDMGSLGQFGIATVAGTDNSKLPTVKTSAKCSDPWLAPDLVLQLAPPSNPLCSHGGSVVHANETFALTWDPNPHNTFAAGYVEQFLKDVANGSGTLGSPFALTPQYRDASGAAGNSSLFGGGFHDATAYPAGGGCTPTGIHHFAQTPGGLTDTPNDVCLTDPQLKAELASMVQQNGIIGRTQPGHQAMLVLTMPPGVVTCLDTAGKFCSVNSDATTTTAQFCSYHSQVTIGNTTIPYVVQPYSVATACDEPDASPKLKFPIDAQTLTNAVGALLVSPISRAQISAIVNPAMNGWFANNGAEIGDNGCMPINQNLDAANVGGGSYFLQREFNNAGAIMDNPFTMACAPNVALQPSFVVPSPINAGDVVQIDASKSPSTLVVPSANFAWNFGDGTTGTGPSVVHSYPHGGNFTVKLTITDRGGDVATATQTTEVLGANGAPPPTPTPTGPTQPTGPALKVRLQLIPQGMRAMLRDGVRMRVTSNEAADGVASLSIGRDAARAAHIRVGSGRSAVIGRGTLTGIKDGTVMLRLRMSPATAAKLSHLKHLTVTIRLALVGARGDRLATDVAGRY
jgi:hypothetical protein